jgi:MATE family multidrug resistance protein
LGYSLIISNILNARLGALYIFVYQPLPESIFWFSAETFQNWGEYLSITIPGTILFSLQLTAFEFLSFIALWVSIDDYTVHIIIYNLWLISTVISYSMSATAVIFIGSEIALGNYKRMKKYVLAIFFIGLSAMFILSFLYFNFRNFFLNIYTTDEKIINKATNPMILLSFLILFDFTQNMLSGICRGLNRYNISLIITFSSLYGVQLVLAIVLGKFTTMGVLGIWVAVLIACFTCFVAFSIYIQSFDLKQIHNETVNRLNEENKSGQTPTDSSSKEN